VRGEEERNEGEGEINGPRKMNYVGKRVPSIQSKKAKALKMTARGLFGGERKIR